MNKKLRTHFILIAIFLILITCIISLTVYAVGGEGGEGDGCDSGNLCFDGSHISWVKVPAKTDNRQTVEEVLKAAGGRYYSEFYQSDYSAFTKSNEHKIYGCKSQGGAVYILMTRVQNRNGSYAGFTGPTRMSELKNLWGKDITDIAKDSKMPGAVAYNTAYNAWQTLGKTWKNKYPWNNASTMGWFCAAPSTKTANITGLAWVKVNKVGNNTTYEQNTDWTTNKDLGGDNTKVVTFKSSSAITVRFKVKTALRRSGDFTGQITIPYSLTGRPVAKLKTCTNSCQWKTNKKSVTKVFNDAVTFTKTISPGDSFKVCTRVYQFKTKVTATIVDNAVDGLSYSGNGKARACIEVKVQNDPSNFYYEAQVKMSSGSASVTSDWDSESQTGNDTTYTSTVKNSIYRAFNMRSQGSTTANVPHNKYYSNYHTSGANTNNYSDKITGIDTKNNISPTGNYNVSVPVGTTKKFCQTITHDREIQMRRKNSTTYPRTVLSTGTAKACINIINQYNFNTGVKVDLTANADAVFVGEKVNAKFLVTAEPRQNPKTGTTYVSGLPADTKIQTAQFIIFKNADLQSIINSDFSHSTYDHTLSSNENLCDAVYGISGQIEGCEIIHDQGVSYNGGGIKSVNLFKSDENYIVPDNSDYVGAKYCVVAGISHTDSGDEADALANANDAWNISAISCRTIAAKPSIQVWNSGTYTNAITTSQSHKYPNAILSDNIYQLSGAHLYGSWGETFILARGTTSGIASGATIGYGNFASSLRANVKNCKITPLTIANPNCTSTTGNSGVNANINDVVARLKNRYEKDIETEKLRIIHASGTYRIDHNICSGSGTCNSSGDLILANRNNSVYDHSSQLPQVIIFAPNIEISDNVDQIDAWLIADGYIDTCVGHSINDLTSHDCDKTLIFNGPVFANELRLNRTSFDTGDTKYKTVSNTSNLNAIYSSTSAEIFNLRADVYLWAHNQAANQIQAGISNLKELSVRQ